MNWQREISGAPGRAPRSPCPDVRPGLGTAGWEHLGAQPAAPHRVLVPRGALWWVPELCRALGLIAELQPLGGNSEELINNSATEVAGGGNAGDKQSWPRVRRLPAAECLSK